MRARNDTSEVHQAAEGSRLRAALLWLLFPLSLFAEPAAPAYSISDFVMCGSAEMVDPHYAHVPGSIFLTADDKFYAWIEMTNVEGMHPVEMKVFRPDGTYYGKELQTTHETNGVADWWRMSAWWQIKGADAAQAPGLWRMDLVIDGDVQRSLYFDILGQPEPATFAQSSVTNLVTPSQKGGMCIVEASSDLALWTPVLTNALPSGLLQGTVSSSGGFRLTLGGGLRHCVLEASPDLLNWTPVQTNDLSNLSPLETSNATSIPALFFRAVIH